MLTSRFFKLFSSFTPRERRAFKKFVRSPFHNAREDAVILYDYILENHRKTSLLERQVVFAECFPKDSYDDAKMRQVMTHICRLMEQYLAIDSLLQDEVQVKIFAARSYKDKKLGALTEQCLFKAEESLNKRNIRNRNYYETSYQIQLEKHHSMAIKGRGKPIDLELLNESLELSFILEKLHRACYALTLQNVFKTEHSKGLTPAIIRYIEEGDLLRIPAVKVYYTAYQTLMPAPEEHWFYELKKQLVVYQNLFPVIELRGLLLAANNYCIKMINKGHKKMLKELFSLFQYGLEFDLLTINGELSRFTYLNIATSGLKSGEFEWVKDFLYEYKTKLDTRYRDSYFSYNLANFHFFRKDYSETMKLLVKVEYDDQFINLSAKTILLKTYFELKEWEALDSFLTSFKAFLYRKKVMGYHKDNYQNIIDLTRKISLLGAHNFSGIPVVQRAVEEMKPNTEREWMLGRIEELKK